MTTFKNSSQIKKNKELGKNMMFDLLTPCGLKRFWRKDFWFDMNCIESQMFMIVVKQPRPPLPQAYKRYIPV